MANRNFNRYQALEKEVKTLYAEIAHGAASVTLTKGLGIESVVRTGGGAYTITLEDKYTRLLYAHATLEDTIAGGNSRTAVFRSEDVSGAKTVSFVYMDEDASENDPDNGNRSFIKIEVKNSTSGE